MTQLLESLSSLLGESFWLAPVIALLAGVLASLMPCCLSTLPLIIAFVGGASEKSTKKAFQLALLYVSGMAVTFTALGTAASLFGEFFGQGAKWWYLVLGVLMVLMTLQTWGILNIIPSTYLTSKNKKTGAVGAFLAGLLGGLFSTPCSTPVLIALLALVASKGNVAWGIMLLLLYSIGHGALALVFGTSVGFVRKLSQSEKFSKVSKALNIVMGAMILLLAFYMFYLGF